MCYMESKMQESYENGEAMEEDIGQLIFEATGKTNEQLKISIRFMTNDIRADALNIKVFNRKCSDNLINCNYTETSGVIVAELKKEILKKATLYKEQDKKKKKK